MRLPAWAPILITGLPLLGGCYGSHLLREPVTVNETARNVEATRQQQVVLEQRLQALERAVNEQAELLRSMKAEDASRNEELEKRLLAIDSMLRDALPARAGYAASPPIWRAAPAGGDNPAPAYPGENAGAAETGTPEAGGPETGAVTTPGEASNPVEATEGAAEGAAPQPGSEEESKRVYDQARLDLNRGNYSLAVLGFREYLRRSPDSDLSDNAQYWIGECYYAQREFNAAIEEFLKVPEQYPRGDKVPAALLKIGYSYLQLDDRPAARRYLNQVIEQFPQSDEAGQARNKLRSGP